MEELTTARSILRKDLESVGMIPTGVAVQMIAQKDPDAGFALLIEAVYVQMFNNRTYEEIVDYLTGPMQVQEGMAAYLISFAVHVREVFRRHKGNGKATMLELMKDKGADREKVKRLITVCHEVGREFKVPLEKTFAVEEQAAKTPGSPTLDDKQVAKLLEKLRARLREDLEDPSPAAIPEELLPVTLLNANDSDSAPQQVFEVLTEHVLARCIQGWYGTRIRTELTGRLTLPDEAATLILERVRITVGLVRRVNYDRPRIERTLRELMGGDPEELKDRIRAVRAVFEAMRRGRVSTIVYRAKPWWKFW